jgi:hypothetical protein
MDFTFRLFQTLEMTRKDSLLLLSDKGQKMQSNESICLYVHARIMSARTSFVVHSEKREDYHHRRTMMM